jgi:hypothetical protein
MNVRQRTIVILGLSLLTLTGLFPPSLVHVQILRESSEPVASYYEPGGYRFLFAFPKSELSEKGPWWYEGQQLDASEANKKGNGGTYFLRSWNIDYRRLLLEWLIFGGLATTGYLTMVDLVRLSAASRRDLEATRGSWAARHPRIVRVLACSVVLVAVFSICLVLVLRMP